MCGYAGPNGFTKETYIKIDQNFGSNWFSLESSDIELRFNNTISGANEITGQSYQNFWWPVFLHGQPCIQFLYPIKILGFNLLLYASIPTMSLKLIRLLARQIFESKIYLLQEQTVAFYTKLNLESNRFSKLHILTFTVGLLYINHAIGLYYKSGYTINFIVSSRNFPHRSPKYNP